MPSGFVGVGPQKTKQKTTKEIEIFKHTFERVVGPFVELHELTTNNILLPWVKMICSESDAVVVKGNAFPGSLDVTYHSNFCVCVCVVRPTPINQKA